MDEISLRDETRLDVEADDDAADDDDERGTGIKWTRSLCIE